MIKRAACFVTWAGCVAAAAADAPAFTTIQPVHFGLAGTAIVDVEVTFLTPRGRIAKRIKGVDAREWAGRVLVVKED